MPRDADFYDRSGSDLRCRECGFKIVTLDGPWLDARIGDAVPCPNCALSSRVPSLDEAEWPNRKDRDDPMRGVPMTERDRQGVPPDA